MFDSSGRSFGVVVENNLLLTYYLRLAFFSPSKLRSAYNYASTIRENSRSHPHSIHCPHPVRKIFAADTLNFHCFGNMANVK